MTIDGDNFNITKSGHSSSSPPINFACALALGQVILVDDYFFTVLNSVSLQSSGPLGPAALYAFCSETCRSNPIQRAFEARWLL